IGVSVQQLYLGSGEYYVGEACNDSLLNSTQHRMEPRASVRCGIGCFRKISHILMVTAHASPEQLSTSCISLERSIFPALLRSIFSTPCGKSPWRSRDGIRAHPARWAQRRTPEDLRLVVRPEGPGHTVPFPDSRPVRRRSEASQGGAHLADRRSTPRLP